MPEPITGVDVMAGLEDRHRRLVADGEPVVTGLVLVGDAWAGTNPALGRGTSIGAVHARALQQLLREVDVADADKVVRAFDDVTGAIVEPMYRATVAFDRHRLAELAGEIRGVPYETDDPGWAMTKALTAAALVDPDALRLYARTALLLEPAASVFADRAAVGLVQTLGAAAPGYPAAGPDPRRGARPRGRLEGTDYSLPSPIVATARAASGPSLEQDPRSRRRPGSAP